MNDWLWCNYSNLKSENLALVQSDFRLIPVRNMAIFDIIIVYGSEVLGRSRISSLVPVLHASSVLLNYYQSVDVFAVCIGAFVSVNV
jgi:hypothetical protein